MEVTNCRGLGFLDEDNDEDDVTPSGDEGQSVPRLRSGVQDMLHGDT